jgi:hypothetical protein
MEHILLNKASITTWGQQALKESQLMLASDIMNLLGYWDTDYGESVWLRIKHKHYNPSILIK